MQASNEMACTNYSSTSQLENDNATTGGGGGGGGGGGMYPFLVLADGFMCMKAQTLLLSLRTIV